MSTEAIQRELSVTRIFEAPVERVWQHWHDPALVQRWWGPQGFTVPVADMDFREGGRSLVCMRAPQEYGGQDLYNTWTYRRIQPHQEIEFVLNFSDKEGRKLEPAQIGLPPGVPADVRHVITFKVLTPSQTEMTVTEYGYTTDQARDISKSGLVECIDKMAASLQAPS